MQERLYLQGGSRIEFPSISSLAGRQDLSESGLSAPLHNSCNLLHCLDTFCHNRGFTADSAQTICDSSDIFRCCCVGRWLYYGPIAVPSPIPWRGSPGSIRHVKPEIDVWALAPCCGPNHLQ